MLYPTELLGHISKIFNFPAQTDSNELPLRRRPLYPTELRGLLQKIFNFAELQDSNDSIFRRRVLYPAELLGHVYLPNHLSGFLKKCQEAAPKVARFFPSGRIQWEA